MSVCRRQAFCILKRSANGRNEEAEIRRLPAKSNDDRNRLSALQYHHISNVLMSAAAAGNFNKPKAARNM